MFYEFGLNIFCLYPFSEHPIVYTRNMQFLAAKCADTQDDTQDETQDFTQDDTQDDTQNMGFPGESKEDFEGCFKGYPRRT